MLNSWLFSQNDAVAFLVAYFMPWHFLFKKTLKNYNFAIFDAMAFLLAKSISES